MQYGRSKKVFVSSGVYTSLLYKSLELSSEQQLVVSLDAGVGGNAANICWTNTALSNSLRRLCDALTAAMTSPNTDSDSENCSTWCTCVFSSHQKTVCLFYCLPCICLISRTRCVSGRQHSLYAHHTAAYAAWHSRFCQLTIVQSISAWLKGIDYIY